MTTSIRVPDTISKLDPDDTYPVVMGTDVGGFTDLKNEVNDNTSKIETNITNITSLTKAGKTKVINNVGDSTPQWDSEPHGNYLLVQRSQTKTVTIETPDPTGGMLDGAILTIYNESPTQAARIIPGDASDTLNSASAMTIPAENFVSFVYQLKDRNFMKLESGYIPAGRINIANYIEQKLSTDGKLHTVDDLVAAGLIKSVKVTGDAVSSVPEATWLHFVGATISAGKDKQAVITVKGDNGGLTPTEAVLRFLTISERDKWSASEGSKYNSVIAIVDEDADGEPAWFKWVSGAWADFYPNGNSGGSSSGITLDDGTSDAASITKINMKGMHLTELPSQGGMASGEVEITAGPSIHMPASSGGQGSGIVTDVEVMPPLSVYMNPNVQGAESVVLEVDHAAFEPMQSPDFLAYLQEEVEVVGKIVDGRTIGHPHGAVWLDDVVVPNDGYLVLDRPNKLYGIQEADELDPNVSGGMNYLVIWRVALKGKAPDDGYVRAYIGEKKVGQQGVDAYLTDINSHPMIVQRHYKADEELGYLQVMGIVNAKNVKEFQLFVEDDFADDNVILGSRDEGATGLMIQAIKSDDKTGRALLQFMHDTGQSIVFNSHYLGPERMSIDWIVQQDVPVRTGDTGQTMTDGTTFQPLATMKMGIENGHILFQDDGTHIDDFYFGKVFGADETNLLGGKVVTVKATLVDKDDAFNVGLFKWTGTPDETTQIYSSRNNGALILNTGWTLVDSLFISEDPVTGDHTVTKDFTVPADAHNYAVVIYPVTAQDPVTLKLKEFTLDVKEPFTGVVLRDPQLTSEEHLVFSNEYKEFSQGAQGYASLRYTINNSPTNGLPMPIGEVVKGNADVVLDTTATVANVPGSGAKGGEGCLKFNADGNAHIVTGVKLWNEQGTDTVVKFWWSEVSPDGTTVKELPDSVFTATVKAGAKGAQYFFAYDHDFEKGARISLRASADKADGAFLQATPSVSPMVVNKVSFKELIAVDGDDPWGQLDLSQFEHVYTHELDGRIIIRNASGASVNFVIEPHMYFDVKRAIKIENGVARPVRSLDYSYNYATHELRISLGETVEEARVLVGVYV